MFPENSNKIWISEGDPTGISPEILIKSIPKIKNILRKKTVVFVQSQTSIKINSIPLITNHKEIQGLKKGIYTFLNENLINNKLKPGKPSIHSGKISFLSLSKTIELQKTFGGNIITLPLSKEWVIKSGIKTFK
ncbi:MAG: 4-hydroxythreonine-4-phosphate dehydrogenase, partial [Leptospiraceae bacterium]|nr:4-hydroxythreonine-4-phosphate dehydrogenase [Leptospiraceae bacterium]